MKILLTTHSKTRLSGRQKKEWETFEKRLKKGILAYLQNQKKLSQLKQVSLSVTLITSADMKKLNKQTRGKNKPTDVLSFPIYENLRTAKSFKELIPLPQVELGDLIICKEVSLSQADSFDIDWCSELLHLGVHGFCHLLGYDHEISVKEEKLMQREESKMLNLF